MPGVDHGQILLEEMVNTISRGTLGNIITLSARVHLYYISKFRNNSYTRNCAGDQGHLWECEFKRDRSLSSLSPRCCLSGLNSQLASSIGEYPHKI